VAELLALFFMEPGHEFWPDDISLLEGGKVDTGRLFTSPQVTDSYLLALAKHHQGQLATFDHRLIVAAVPNGAQSLHLIR